MMGRFYVFDDFIDDGSLLRSIMGRGAELICMCVSNPEFMPRSAVAWRPGVAVFVVLVMAMGCGTKGPPGSSAPSAAKRQTDVESPGEQAADARPRSGEYVGSAACARCHADEARAYHDHPMSQSLFEAGRAPPLEDYSQSAFSPWESLVYYAEKGDSGVVHHEQRTDAAGKVLYDQAVSIAFAVGAGERGRSYLINLDGRMYASPVSWYNGPARWGLSPGYGPDNNPRFERRVSDGCLSCHAGRVAAHGQDIDRFGDPPFLELSIGCERCHGPGQKHVRFQSGPHSGEGRDAIVNPARLNGAKRDAVCNQCHLQGRRRVVRTGRTEFDFRPGEFLGDNWVVFLKTAGVREGTAAAVSQVEQLYASRCYWQSGGALACITCHGGHNLLRGDDAAHAYRDVCLGCHSDGKKQCSEDVARRQAATAADSCVVCHMPKFPASDVHAAQTEHRILRKPSPADTAGAPAPVSRDVKPALFDEPGATVDGLEWDRARGIYLAERAAASGNTDQAKEAVELLVPALNRAPRDVEARYLLGRAYLKLGQPHRAVRAWEKVLAIQPRHEDVLEALAIYYHEAQDLAAARQYYERLLEVNPDRSYYYGRLAHVLGQLGETRRGIDMAETCLELNPTLVQTHAWLVEAYRLVGDHERAAAHQAILSRFPPERGKKP
jgi:hypothetical protein